MDVSHTDSSEPRFETYACGERRRRCERSERGVSPTIEP
jgi:hypothetical protein